MSMNVDVNDKVKDSGNVSVDVNGVGRGKAPKHILD